MAQGFWSAMVRRWPGRLWRSRSADAAPPSESGDTRVTATGDTRVTATGDERVIA